MIFSSEFHSLISARRHYAVGMGIAAFILMLSGLVPMELLLIPAVAAAPGKSRKLCLAAAVGSALGALALAALARHVGWPLLDRLAPELAGSRGWVLAQAWIARYGVLALTAIAALPIAQAPALLVCGLMQMSLPGVLVAFLVGKVAKYSLLAALVVKSESRLAALANGRWRRGGPAPASAR